MSVWSTLQILKIHILSSDLLTKLESHTLRLSIRCAHSDDVVVNAQPAKLRCKCTTRCRITYTADGETRHRILCSRSFTRSRESEASRSSGLLVTDGPTRHSMCNHVHFFADTLVTFSVHVVAVDVDAGAPSSDRNSTLLRWALLTRGACDEHPHSMAIAIALLRPNNVFDILLFYPKPITRKSILAGLARWRTGCSSWRRQSVLALS